MAKEKNEYFRLLPEEIKKSKELKQSDKNVLAALIFCDNSFTIEKDKNDGYFYQSLEDLVKLSKISKKHTVNSLSYLEIKGYISRIVGDFKKRKPTKYKVNIEYKETDKETVNDTDKETDKNIEIIPLKKDTDKETDIAIDNQSLTELNKNSFLEQKETKEKEEEEDKDKEIAILNLSNNLLFFENPLKEDFQKNNLNNNLFNNLFKEHIEDMKEIDFNERLNKAALYCKELENKINSFESKIKTLEIRLKYLEEKYRESKANDKTDDDIDLNSINITDLDLSKEKNKELYNKYINKILQ